jgi:hypothetical protein
MRLFICFLFILINFQAYGNDMETSGQFSSSSEQIHQEDSKSKSADLFALFKKAMLNCDEKNLSTLLVNDKLFEDERWDPIITDMNIHDLGLRDTKLTRIIIYIYLSFDEKCSKQSELSTAEVSPVQVKDGDTCESGDSCINSAFIGDVSYVKSLFQSFQGFRHFLTILFAPREEYDRHINELKQRNLLKEFKNHLFEKIAYTSRKIFAKADSSTLEKFEFSAYSKELRSISLQIAKNGNSCAQSLQTMLDSINHKNMLSKVEHNLSVSELIESLNKGYYPKKVDSSKFMNEYSDDYRASYSH